ncbi:DUF58 domain-containing protein [Quadrisphaera setariae]|uniref:DUF58 domain-containing protein n=1 Tax=Quadrisphaera setariae TaxID=2593304 RepID=A0A5C8ZLN6_9ACTN|nr:DUF58 domain-containing protein [Quadrisphaera setariae]TXR58083.1 DUF58 domain-containing protein [Quadrisphaera setariae]
MVLTGRWVLLVAVGALPAALVPALVHAGGGGSGWLPWAGVLGWAVVVVGLTALDLLLAGSPRSLSVRREETGPVRLGERTAVPLVVENTGARRVRGALRDAWGPSAGVVVPAAGRHRFDAPPGERRRLVTELEPVRRGDREVAAVVVRSRGPLGVAARQRTLPVPGRVRVLPPFSSRRHLPAALERLRTLDGSASVQVRGQGTEFDSLREWVDGDDARSVDWRATARRGSLVVRTWRPERDRRVLVVLDTSRTSAARIGDAPRLDAAMDAALLLAAVAATAGDRVDLLAADRTVRAAVTSQRPPALMPALVQAMAPLEPALVEADWPALVAQVRRRMPHRGLLVLLTPLEPAAEAGLLPVLSSLTALHAVVVASVADPALDAMASERGEGGAAGRQRPGGPGRRRAPDAADAYTAAAAERTRLERAALTALVRRTGAVVVDADPDLLPSRLADAYLSLKAAGRL